VSKRTLRKALAKLEKWIEAQEATAPKPPPPTAEELCAQLAALAEEGRARREAIESVLARPGAADLTDEEVAARCPPAAGVTAEAVHLHRHPPPMTPERQAKIDDIKDFFRRREAALKPPDELADDERIVRLEESAEELVDQPRAEAAAAQPRPQPAPALAKPQPQPPQPESRTLTVEDQLHTPLPTTPVWPPSRRRRPLAFHEGDRGWTRLYGFGWCGGMP
jgi:hypothetical protein